MTVPNPFGVSLALDDGDLVLDGGSLRLVTGLTNLKQALTLRVYTPLGSDRFNTTYGLDVRRALTQPNSRRMARELLRLDLVRTLASDPRVAEVREVKFAGDPDLPPGALKEDREAAERAAQAREAAERAARIASVEVVIETVTGATTTLFVDPTTVRR